MQRVEMPLGRFSLSIETGRMAKQADGAVVVRLGDTMVLATACAQKEPRAGVDFMPLTVDYRENTYAAGKIPGGFFKREGRPNEKEILTSRMIDRPLRPLFPEGYACETQVVGLLLSADLENDSDTLSIIGASTALGLLTGIDGLALHWGISRRMLFMWIFWGVRYSATVLCIASSLLAVCASLFEQKIPRYVSVHAYLLALYFGSIAAGYLTYNLKLLSAETAGVFMVGSAAGLYVLWGLLMTGSTEAAPAADTDPARDGAEGREPQANGLGKQVA